MVLFTREHFISSDRIFEGKIFNVRKDRLERDDVAISREVVEHNGGVVIACQPERGRILLIGQYRYPIDEELIELPAGRVELGEDRFLAAKRELTEETGFFANTWKELAHMYSAPGFCNELLSFYQATDLEFQGKKLDEDEETDVLDVTLEEAWSWVKAGKIRDAKTVAGLGMLMHP
ncbi:MAG: NUDIX hydrolase [Candidatus Obscuribacterales bacterium]|jgi:ADP-ribose pyrophosphatase|nr:NUDIX hydrolase [Candidatus Obscuribacterales bacterium]